MLNLKYATKSSRYKTYPDVLKPDGDPHFSIYKTVKTTSDIVTWQRTAVTADVSWSSQTLHPENCASHLLSNRNHADS